MPASPRSQEKTINGNIDIKVLLAFVTGILFVAVMLCFAVFFENPTGFQERVFIVVLSLAASGVGSVMPGFVGFTHSGVKGLGLKAGGAIALFLVVYLTGPAITRTVATVKVPIGSARSSIDSFLKVLDSGDLKSAIDLMDTDTRKNWMDMFETTKQVYANSYFRLGKLLSRDLFSYSEAISPAGFPVGAYQFFTFRSKFENGPECFQELIVAKGGEDMKWRVASHTLDKKLPC